MTDHRSSKRPEYDQIIQKIVDYVFDTKITSNLAYETARHCLLDSIGCAILALNYPACTKVLGPIVPGAELKNGARVLGCQWELDPARAAFNNGALIRWLDFNDTWLAAEWGHPSDNLGAILAAADYANRNLGKSHRIQSILETMIKAHEIQGVLALNHSFNRVGLDHVLLVRIASTAVSSWLLGANKEQTLAAVSHAWLDGSSLRTYRHAPNTGPRKSWAAGDACSRAIFLSLMALKGQMGYPSAITAPTWGFQDVCFKGQEIKAERPFGSYVMENILFKISFPAEFHAQTAVEAGIVLHPHIKNRLNDIERIEMETTEAGVRIIDKTGPLDNPADRDHCLQYMTAIGLIFGELTADHYEDDVAGDPRIDALRNKMIVIENKQFTQDYFDADKRAIGNAITVHFKDGTCTERVAIDYPVGHKFRREEGIPLLLDKARNNLGTQLAQQQTAALMQLLEGDCLTESIDQFLSSV